MWSRTVPTWPPTHTATQEYGGIEYDGLPVTTAYCIALQLFSSDAATVERSEIEDDTQCRIYAAHLVEAEEPDALTEPARVDRRSLLGKHPGVHAADFNLGTKAGGTSRR